MTTHTGPIQYVQALHTANAAVAGAGTGLAHLTLIIGRHYAPTALRTPRSRASAGALNELGWQLRVCKHRTAGASCHTVSCYIPDLRIIDLPQEGHPCTPRCSSDLRVI